MAHLILLASTTHHICLQMLEPDISERLRSTCSNHPSPFAYSVSIFSLVPGACYALWSTHHMGLFLLHSLGPHLIDNSLLTKTFVSPLYWKATFSQEPLPVPLLSVFFPLPTPLLSPPLLGKCHHRAAYFVYFYYKNQTGVPGSFSHPTGPLPMKRDSSPL